MSLNEPFARAFKLHQQGKLREAFDAYRAVLAAAPSHAPALHYSGLILHQCGRSAEAVAPIERSVTVDPAAADAWSNLALVYGALNRHADALRALGEATRRAPHDASLWENYAASLIDARHFAEAEHASRHAAMLDARSPGAWYNLALAHYEQRHLDEALDAISRALALAPDAMPLVGLKAAVEEARGTPEVARATLAAALQRNDETSLKLQLASLCERIGDLGTAASAYEQVLRTGDPTGAALSQLLFIRKRLADWHDLDDLRARFRAGIRAQLPLLSPFCLLSDPSSRAEQRRCAEAWVRAFGTGSSSGTDVALGVGTARPSAKGTSGDRLTIGYLSADFHLHATALLTAGLFEHHNRKRYHVVAYSTGRDDESPLRIRLEAAFDSFVDAAGWPAERVAARIRQDGVDILVDLKGHTEHARMDVLALRAAPIQVAYLGFPGTTGAPFIDYVIGDRVVTPLAHGGDYTEALVLLPCCYQVNDRERRIATPPSREVLGLPGAADVLCCFNQAYKIGPQVFDAWAEVLKRAPNTVLWLLTRSHDDAAVAHLRREATHRGIAAERLVVAAARPNAEYLSLYAHAALCLDTWPYNGHTTTSDALWTGCPVVTTLGDTFAGRVAASLLDSVGLPELVATSVDDYIELTLALVHDAPRRARLRLHLEQARHASPLFDVASTTRAIEAAYELMVAQRRSGVIGPISVPAFGA
ncbi:MAG: tetratricopeptide repeat protein [Pseudomonadota bacterium]|nr:tetratricopeptide repeat protein [Pseudomonadota bacterium]